MTSSSPTRAFLSHLHRGGQYSYWWTAQGRQSIWWEVATPAPLPGGRRDVYFGVNPTAEIPTTNRRGEPRELEHLRGQIAHVAALNCFYGDFDAKDYGGLDAALAHIDGLEPAPSVVIATGGGYHCYWLLRHPWRITNDDERQRAADAQAGWVSLVGADDSVKDLARVLRVPGTHNYKYDPAPVVAFVRCDLGQLYDRCDLLALLPEPDAAPVPTSGPTPSSRTPEWAAKKLATAIGMATLAADGAKHTQLLKAATLAGGCVPHLTEQEIETALYSAIVGRAKDAKGALDTIRDGIAWGRAHPLTPPADLPALVWKAGAPYCPDCGQEARPSNYHDGLYCGAHSPAHNWRGQDAATPAAKGQPEYVAAPPPVESWIDQGVTLAELQTKHFDDLRWIVQDILPEGVCLVAAKPKAKKSWLALGIGIAVAMGTPALGHLRTIPGRVLFLDLEGNQRRIKSRTRAMLGTQNTPWPENFHVFTKWKKGPECIEMLEQWMTVNPDTGAIVIDLLAEIRPPMDPKANAYAYDRELLVELNRFAEHYHIAIIVIHHTRKAKGEDVFDEVSGTLGINGAVSTLWIISKSPEGHVILSMTGRDLQKDEPLALSWDNYACNFTIEGSAIEVAISEERKAILSLMDDDSTWTPKQIAAELGKSVGSTQQLLRLMIEDGTIDKAGYGKYSRVPPKSPNSPKSLTSPKSPKSREGEATLREDPPTLRGHEGGTKSLDGSGMPQTQTLRTLRPIHSEDDPHSDTPAAQAAALTARLAALKARQEEADHAAD